MKQLIIIIIIIIIPKSTYRLSSQKKYKYFNLLATDFFFQILAHPVFKM